jgi:uncharacterized protein
VIVVDTGGLYAFLDADDAHHATARVVVTDEPGPFLLSQFVLAELDALVQMRLGVEASAALLDDVSDGAYTLVPFGNDDVARAASLVRQYADLGIGLTDASVAVIADRFGTHDLLCTDERHFRAIRPLRGEPAFRLLEDLAKG